MFRLHLTRRRIRLVTLLFVLLALAAALAGRAAPAHAAAGSVIAPCGYAAADLNPATTLRGPCISPAGDIIRAGYQMTKFPASNGYARWNYDVLGPQRAADLANALVANRGDLYCDDVPGGTGDQNPSNHECVGIANAAVGDEVHQNVYTLQAHYN